MDDLPGRAGVVVVGGGAVGTSVARELAHAGVRDVVVLEAGTVGSGSSGKPIGGLRAHFTDALNVALAVRSLRAYDELGLAIDRVGYLFLLRTPEQVALLEQAVALQNEHGVPSRLITASEALALAPMLDPSPFLAASWSPTDGHARPAEAVDAWVDDARRHGARVVEHCEVTGIDVAGGEVTAVRTTRGTVDTGVVVCAAGAWSRGIGAMAGVELDVRPVRRQLCFTAPPPGGHPRVPFTIDLTTSFYFHNADDGLLLGWSDPAQADGFGRDYDEGWLGTLREHAAACAPSLAALPVRGGWAGLYEQTPDANALIGEAAGVGRFLYATGFSGHGFSQAPAAGELVCDLLLDRPTFVDIRPLRAERFAERQPLFETTIV